jgi:NTP pyrophosphatase (non-canonical NTP hydrolase)
MSEIYFNKPNYGVGPEDPYAFSRHPYEPSQEYGGFYNISARERVDVDNITSLSDYQNFVNENWKSQHGTYDSTARFGEKLEEECDELLKAYESASDTRKKDIISELGDVAFCAVALASNSSADLDRSTKIRLFQYIHGVKAVDSDHPDQEPVWRDNAANLSTKSGPIEISDIDQLIEDGFEPLHSPIMNVWENDAPQFDERQHLGSIAYRAMCAISGAKQQYKYGGDDENLSRFKNYDYYTDDIGEMTADIMLEIAYLAKTSLAKTLNDMLQKNIQKITKRTTAGLIDKADGQRSEDLL